MSTPSLSSETLHTSCVVKNAAAVLISGRSGSGKSDLTLRLIDRGATLVSDDYTIVRRVSGQLLASAPPNIVGKLEVHGLGILDFDTASDVPVALFVDLDREAERLPDPIVSIVIAGITLPLVAVNSFEASAPVKVELALDRFGLKT